MKAQPTQDAATHRRLTPGERLDIGTPVQVGKQRGLVSGWVEPTNFNQVLANVVTFTERAKTGLAWSVKWVPMPHKQTRPVNYAFISRL
jgi:hypothetical protein